MERVKNMSKLDESSSSDDETEEKVPLEPQDEGLVEKMKGEVLKISKKDYVAVAVGRMASNLD